MLVYNCGKMPVVFCSLEEAKKLMNEEPKIVKILDLKTNQCVASKGIKGSK